MKITGKVKRRGCVKGAGSPKRRLGFHPQVSCDGGVGIPYLGTSGEAMYLST